MSAKLNIALLSRNDATGNKMPSLLKSVIVDSFAVAVEKTIDEEEDFCQITVVIYNVMKQTSMSKYYSVFFQSAVAA